MNLGKLLLGAVFTALLLGDAKLKAQGTTPEVNHLKTILLTETDQGNISLVTSRFGLSITKFLHDDNLDFFARQMSDSSYLRINTNTTAIQHRFHAETFFLFRTNTNPIQSVSKKYPKDYKIENKNIEKYLIYDFYHEKMLGAVELEDRVSQSGKTYLVAISGIIPTAKLGNILVVQFLVDKSTSDFYFYKLDNFANPLSGLKSLSMVNPQNWQKIDMNTTPSILKLSTRTDQPFPLGAGNLQMDLNEEYVGLRHRSHLFGNLNTGKVYELSESRLDRNWTLINDGKVVFEKREKEETKSGTNYYSTVVVYDFVNDKQVKQITLPGKKVYEVRFSGGKYLVYWDSNPPVTHFEPKLFDMETETVVDINFPAVLEKNDDPKKKKIKATMAQICVANGILYKIQDVVFSKDLKKFAILSNLNLKSSASEVKYMVNGKQVLDEEFIDLYSIN